ncbi:MAG: hypothetical protein ABIQ39_03835, partial [Ilumatobacteraceae bacterium]
RLDRYGAGQDIGFDEPDGPAFDLATDIDIFTGGAVLFSTAFLDDLDGFDERYFMYYEDVDLALRGQRRGWVYRCAPASRVWHEGGVSADGAPAQRIFVTERNRIWCLFRFAGWRSMASGLGLAVRRTRHAPRSVHFRALVAGLRGGPRRLWERRAGGH